MRNSKYIACLLMLSLISACQQIEIPLDDAGVPVFSFSGEVDGQDMTFAAGVDDYYLFTEAFVDEHDVVVLSGQLGPVGTCPQSCPSSLAIELRSEQSLDQPDPLVLNPTEVSYYNGLADPYDTSLSPVHVDFINTSIASEDAEYLWEFGNQVTSDEETPASVMFGPGVAGDIQSASLTLTTASGCTSTFSRDFELVAPVVPDCPLLLSLEQGIGPAEILLCASLDAAGPLVYSWQGIGGAFLASDPCISLTGLTDGVYQVNATAPDGCTSSREFSVLQSESDPVVCSARFETLIQETPGNAYDIDKIGFSTVNIKYTDADGVLYQSALLPDQSVNIFNIVSSQPYEENESGLATYRFDFNFNAWLANEAGDLIEIRNASGTWAVAVE